jgi:hypothetical protein
LRNDAQTIQRLVQQGTPHPLNETDGERMMNNIGAVQYMECSALTGQGLKSVFDNAIRIAIRGTRPRKQQNSKSGSNCCLL